MARNDTAFYAGHEVTVIDRETHHGYEAVKIEANDDSVTITDPSGEAWVDGDELVYEEDF